MEDSYYNYNGNYDPVIIPRSIPLAIIFSLITCGIYQIYWMYKINEEINQLAGEYDATPGAMVILFTILTCGIYYLYWNYKMGERCDRIKTGTSGYLGILFLILAIFKLGIINFCLLQDTINKNAV